MRILFHSLFFMVFFWMGTLQCSLHIRDVQVPHDTAYEQMKGVCIGCVRDCTCCAAGCMVVLLVIAAQYSLSGHDGTYNSQNYPSGRSVHPHSHRVPKDLKML
jgi:hypothetical protein